MTRHHRNDPRFKDLADLVPKGDASIDWSAIRGLWPELAVLDSCPQDPLHHAEGDVGTHTRMVVEALVNDAGWRKLDSAKQALLFWSAVLHDVGKPATTVHEPDGRITSRGHSRVGAGIARQLLRQAQAPFAFREELCGLIVCHQLPFWLIERPMPERLAIKTSLQCRARDLCLHAKADAMGRVCDDQGDLLENVDLARTVFEDVECLDTPFAFANDESRVAFFEREDRNPGYAAHEDFRCRVTVMAGLPGSGKDTWIAENVPDLPVVSLDALRAELGVSPTGNQGTVIQAARERAREHLRARDDFVWNGTNISQLVRSKALTLLRDYGARIRIVYIEVPPERLLRQNRNRAASVPDDVIVDLSRKLEPPAPWEAHEILNVVDAFDS